MATIVGGGTPSTNINEYWNGNINWYTPAELGNNIYIDKSLNKISELGLRKSSAKILPAGTILFTSRAGIGKTAILRKEAATNQGFQSIIPNDTQLDSYFIFTKTNELKQYGNKTGSGSTFVEVSGKQMKKMPIVVPTISEQKNIGLLFKKIDMYTESLNQTMNQSNSMKSALLRRIFI